MTPIDTKTDGVPSRAASAVKMVTPIGPSVTLNFRAKLRNSSLFKILIDAHVPLPPLREPHDGRSCQPAFTIRLGGVFDSSPKTYENGWVSGFQTLLEKRSLSAFTLPSPND